MGYTVDYQSDKKIIRIKTKGRLNFKIVQQYSMEATKLARRNKCNKFLCDHTETELQEGIYKIHADGSELEQFGFKRTDRLAIVILRFQKDKHFDEKSYQHSEWSNFKYFDNVEDAVRWLVKDE